MPKLLDLGCGEGGVAYAARELGWEVIGVDLKPQSSYPGDFIQGDALTIDLPTNCDLIWCSPYCQGYSIMSKLKPESAKPRQVNNFRQRAISLGKPYVIENVNRCHDLVDPITLCGFMFGLPIIRHRRFEASFLLPQPAHQRHSNNFYQVAGNCKGTLAQWREAMGLPTLSKYGLTQAVPLAYTWYILTWFKASNNNGHHKTAPPKL